MNHNYAAERLARLNSLTKYPSIPTFHPMGDRGRLGPEPARLEGEFRATEKIDGTNARIVLVEDGYFIGSREELLHFRGDVIHNPALGIVEGIREVAERLLETARPADGWLVVFGEFYGGKTTAAAKEYARDGRTGYRLFDAARVRPEEQADRNAAGISLWRENGGQDFVPESELETLAQAAGVTTVPPLFRFRGEEFPTTLGDVLARLEQELPRSRAVLDGEGSGRPEGLVIRNADRSRIYKLRFEDYRRALR